MTKEKTLLLILTAMCATLSFIASYLIIPIGPIPFSLQTLCVFVTALTLPPVYASVSQLISLVLMIFFKGGIALTLQPSFGFLIGFIFIAGLVSMMAHGRSLSIWSLVFLLLIAELFLYTIGLTYMSYIFIHIRSQQLSLWSILAMGCFPFLLPDLVKIALAILISHRIRQFYQRNSNSSASII